MAISTYGVTLNYKTSTASSYSKLIDIKDYPEIIGSPNMIDTTTLSDAQRTSIFGIKGENNAMAFTVNWDKTDIATVKALEGEDLSFELVLGTEGSIEWEGQLAVGISGKGVDEVVEGIIYTSMATVPTLDLT